MQLLGTIVGVDMLQKINKAITVNTSYISTVNVLISPNELQSDSQRGCLSCKIDQFRRI